MIILINGPSSAGKTSLVRALQAKWDGPLVYLSLDAIIGMLPFHYTGTGSHASRGFELYEVDGATPPLTGLRIGPLGLRLNALLAHNAATLARERHDVIIDHVLVDDALLKQFVNAFREQVFWFVGLHGEIGELERREHARGDRTIGLARWQQQAMASLALPYDVAFDSTQMTTDEVSDALLAFVRAPVAET